MITVGRVSQRKHARLHAPTCRIVRHRPLIPATVRALRTEDAPLVCKLCRPILLADAELAEQDANRRAGISTTIRPAAAVVAAEALVASLRTAAETRLAETSRDAFRRQRAAIVAADLALAA